MTQSIRRSIVLRLRGLGQGGPRSALAFFVALLSGTSVPALGQEFHVNLDRGNRVRFVSDAPLEDFEGVTSRIDGFLFLSGEGLRGDTDLSKSAFYFEVDLASLDTGIGLRNRHMRENYLETDRWPMASFEGRVTELRRDGSKEYRASTLGTLSIHGVDMPRAIECTGTPEGEELRVRCTFEVTLSDHDIPIPRLMFMKIDEVMALDLDLFLTPVSGGEGR